MQKKSKLIVILLAAFVVFSFVVFLSNRLVAPNDQQAAVVTQQELRQAGLFDVTAPEFGADKTGVEDSTEEIQAAMDAAYNNNGMTFFPPGRYRISNTLAGLRDRGEKDLYGYQLIGSTDAAELPTIILTQNSFNDDNDDNDSKMTSDGKKKAMLQIWGCTGTGEAQEGPEGCDPDYEDQLKDVNQSNGGVGTGYNGYIRNLHFLIEANNPDAIGVRITGNQGNHVSNILIEANGAFAGFYGTVGTSSFVENLTVIGGKYGVYNGYGAWGSYANVTLRDQELLAFTSPQGPPVSLNGFHIVKQSAPAVGEVPNVDYTSDSTDQNGAFSLNDGIIEFASNNQEKATILTPEDRQISVVNVFVKNAGKLVQAGSTNYSGNPNGWSKINIFSNTIQTNGYKLVDGVETRGEDYTTPDSFVTNNVTPPAPERLKMNHGLAASMVESPDKLMRLAKENGSGVVNVAREGISPLNNVNESSPDYADQINNLINRQGVNTIFFPKGQYPIKDTINLKSNTKIIGINANISKITTHPDWKPGNITDMVNTVNDAEGKTLIALISIEADRSQENDKFNNLHWRVGKDSVIYQVARGGKGANAGCKDAKDPGWGTSTHWLWITDNGGGRVWNGNAGSSNCSRWSAQQRGILISGTTQPLIIYSLNPEDGHGNEDDAREGFMVEIKNAKNVSIRSDKSENDNAILVRNSQNIFILNLGGTVETSLRDNNDILVMNTVAKFHTFGNGENRRPKDLIEEEINGNIVKEYKTTETVSVIKRGIVDFSVWDSDSVVVTSTPGASLTPTVTVTAGASLTPTITRTPGATLTPTITRTPGATLTPTITPTPNPTVTITVTPTGTKPASTPTITPTGIITGNICGKADVDNNGIFDINDFIGFAQAYGDGRKSCGDSQVDYGPCRGRDADRNGLLDINDFGGYQIGFAQRYYPKTSCAID